MAEDKQVPKELEENLMKIQGSVRDLTNQVATEGIQPTGQIGLPGGPIGGKNPPPPNVEDLAGANNLEIPDTTPDISTIEGADAYTAAAKIKQEEADRAKAEADKLKTETPERPKHWTDFLTWIGKDKPSDYREDVEEEYGVDTAEYLSDKKARRAEIETLSTDYNKYVAMRDQQIADMMGRPGIGMDFMNNAVAQINRNAAVVLNQKAANINAKSATLAAISQDFAEAQNLVDKAVDAYTKDLQFEYQVFSDFITANESKIDKLDTEYRQALDDAMNLKLKQYEETKAEKTQVGSLMIDFPNAGINIGDTLEEATTKASMAAATIIPEEDILSVSEAKSLGVPYGTTKQQAYGITPGETGVLPGAEIAPGQLSPIAKAVYDGTIKLTDITPTQRAQIAPELNAVGYTSVIDSETKQSVSYIKNEMTNVLDSWKSVPKNLKGLLQGPISKFFGSGKWNKEVAKFNASVGIVGMQLTRLYEKGRISDADRRFYMSLMPNLSMNEDAAKAGAEELTRLLEEKLTSQLEGFETTKGSSKGSSSTEINSLRDKYNY